MSTLNIEQVDWEGSPTHGKFYAVNSDDEWEYLLRNGVLSFGIPSIEEGYYDTKEEAEAAVSAYEQSLNQATKNA